MPQGETVAVLEITKNKNTKDNIMEVWNHQCIFHILNLKYDTHPYAFK